MDLSHQPPGLRWRRSGKCDGGACVEVAELGETILIRDSAEPNRTPVTVSRDVWRAFISRVRASAQERR